MAKTRKRVEEGNREVKKIISKGPQSKLKCFLHLIFSSLTILQISVGAIYLDECPIQEKIPIYLIVFGVTLLVNPVNIDPRSIKNDFLKKGLECLGCITTLFLFCWFIAGNVWVYSVYQPSYSKNATDVSSYCNKTLYLVAFSVITALNILLGLLLLLATCCALCIYCCISSFQTCFSNIIHADDDVPADEDISGDSAE